MKKVKVYSKGDNVLSVNENVDKRPKKENEYRSMMNSEPDVDYEKYGYRKPDKIPAGKLTLRQFDELLSEYKKDKSQKNLNDLSAKYKVMPENLNLLIEYYKPFNRILKKNEKSNDANVIETVFPNLIDANSSNDQNKK